MNISKELKALEATIEALYHLNEATTKGEYSSLLDDLSMKYYDLRKSEGDMKNLNAFVDVDRTYKLKIAELGLLKRTAGQMDTLQNMIPKDSYAQIYNALCEEIASVEQEIVSLANKLSEVE